MLERRQGTFRSRREPGRALTLLGSERFCRRGGALGELGHVAEPLALLEHDSSVSRLETVRVLRERAQLRQPRLGRRRVARQLVVPAAGRLQRAPGAREPHRGGASCSCPMNESSTSSWYAGRASRRCSNWPDIAINRSPSAASSSRGTERPHA